MWLASRTTTFDGPVFLTAGAIAMIVAGLAVVAAGIRGHACADQGAGTLRGLDHQGRQRQAGHDPVARREVPPQRPGAGRMLADHRATPGDSGVQAGVGDGIGDVGTGAEHGQGQAARHFQRGGMGGGVDARRQSAGDGDAGFGQCAGEQPGVVQAAGAGATAADDGQLRMPQPPRLPGDEQRQRRAGDVAQQRRVVGIAPTHEVVAGGFQPAQAAGFDGQGRGILAAQAVDLAGVEAGGGPRRMARGQHRIGIGIMGFEQGAARCDPAAGQHETQQRGRGGQGHRATIARKPKRRPGAPSCMTVGLARQ